MTGPQFVAETIARGLGVRGPVSVRPITSIRLAQARRHSGGRDLLGNYPGPDPYGTHDIEVLPGRPVPMTLFTIAHELTHALQCERFPSFPAYRAAYMAAGGWTDADRYRENRFEREANDIARALVERVLASPHADAVAAALGGDR